MRHMASTLAQLRRVTKYFSIGSGQMKIVC